MNKNNAVKSAYVNVPVLTLYASAAKDAGRTDEALYGDKVRILEEDPTSGRCRVRTHYHYEGWAAACDLIAANAVTQTWEDAACWRLGQSYADILAAPDITAPALISLVRGSRLVVLSLPDKPGWISVRLLDGRTGYIRYRFLAPYQAPRAISELDESAFREAVTQTALSYLGTQYRWGGRSPLGIDCSGLCFTSYMLNGALIYRDAKMPAGFAVHPIPREKMQKGDLFFFPGHVAMSLGGDRFVHSTSRGGYYGVVVNSLNPADPDFRPDLLAELSACGSIFPIA